MFNGKGRQVRVCHQVGDRLAIGEQLPENSPVPFGWANDSRAGLIQPALYASECLFERERIFKDPWIGSDTNKCRQNGPAQADNTGSGQLVIPPCTRLLVAGMKRILCVQ